MFFWQQGILVGWEYRQPFSTVVANTVFFFPLSQVDEVDEKLLTQLAYNARGDICPMQGVIGGITAQEVMKVHLSLLSTVLSNFLAWCKLPPRGAWKIALNDL